MENINEENTEVQQIEMTEEQYAEFSKQLDLEINDIEEKISQDLTYFQEPIIIEEETIINNKNFKKGLENSMKINGLFTGLVNGGFSRELSEQYAIESVLLDKKLEIAKLEQNNKNLENEFNAI